MNFFHSCVSLISFINALSFLVYSFIISFIKFIPRGFIFYEIINYIAFYIFLPDSSLLVLKNATDFYMLMFFTFQLYWILFISSVVFLVEYLEFSIYKNHVNCKLWQIYSFTIQMFFIPFSWLVVLTRTSSPCWYKWQDWASFFCSWS